MGDELKAASNPNPPRGCVLCGGGPVWLTFGMCGVCIMGRAEYAGEPEPRAGERDDRTPGERAAMAGKKLPF